MTASIKHVTHIITGLNDGGAEGALFRLCQADRGIRHTVISMMDSGKYGVLMEECGVEVITLSMPQGKVTPGGLYTLWKKLRELKPDTVQTWLYHADLVGGVIARLAGVRRVFWGIRHSNLSPGTVKGSTILVAKLCARLSRCVPYKIISCSRQAIQSHTSIGYDAERFLVIPNGYNLAQFRPLPRQACDLRTQLGIGADTVVLGMVGRFDPQKDHRNLLDALAAMKIDRKSVCLLVGTGMDERNQALINMLEDTGTAQQVKLLGRRSDIPAVMSALDIHVLSSLGEAFPNVLAEAMACGTPCVTTDVGDAALIVGDTGWVVPPLNPLELARALKGAVTALDDSESWRRRCFSAQRRIEKEFSIQTMVDSYHAAWSG
jgi:glycosyltransferase involved in cell wall biosynthesis